MKVHAGDECVDLVTLPRHNGTARHDRPSDGDGEDGQYLLVVTSNGFGKLVDTSHLPVRMRRTFGKRIITFRKSVVRQRKPRGLGTEDDAGGGVGVYKHRPVAPDSVVAVAMCRADQEVLITTRKGSVIRQSVQDLKVQSLQNIGMRLQAVKKVTTSPGRRRGGGGLQSDYQLLSLRDGGGKHSEGGAGSYALDPVVGISVV